MNEKSKTHIDLGDDLLGTKTLSRPIPDELLPPPEAAPELLVNAKILIGEGLFSEAKQILRKILLRDATNVQALEKLSEIQKTEIKQLLSLEDSKPRRKFQSKAQDQASLDSETNVADVLAALEKDLGESPHLEKAAAREKTLDRLFGYVEEQYQGASAQDRLDIGVALLEMEAFEVALFQFEHAKKDPQFERRATVLSIYGKILAKRTFEALLDLDALIADESIDTSQRVEYGYLMARALEDLEKFAEAGAWYRGVLEIEAQYRDCFERLKKCEKALSSSSR